MEQSPPETRHIGWRWKKLVLLAMALTGVVAVVFFAPHLWWKFESARLGCNDVRAVPTIAMPDASVPEDWKMCRFGPLEFSLPPELADRLEVQANDRTVVLRFDDGSRSVMMTASLVPEDRAAVFAALRNDYDLPDEGLRLSRTRLQLAAYRADSGDFRWSMSRKDLRWHNWCVRMSEFYRMASPSSAEYVLHDDIEGILDLTPGSKTGEFCYYAAADRFAGSVIFTSKSGSLDKTFMRRVCQSCKFFEDRIPKPVPRDEEAMRALFEVTGTAKEGE